MIDKHSYNNLREVRVVAGRRTWDTFAGRAPRPLRGGREVHPCTTIFFHGGTFGARQGHGSACVNRTWFHCVIQMGATQIKF